MVPFLHLGPVTLPTFGMMVATAMVGAFFVLRADLRRRGLVADAETLVAAPVIAGIAGAKLYHVLESPGDFFADPWHQLFSPFGFAWFGGLVAGFAAFVMLARQFGISLLELCDAASPAAALGYGIGRIGCLLSGDGDYGIPTSLPWGISFPNGLVPTTERVHPTPIYELIVGVAISWILWRLGAKQTATRAPHKIASGILRRRSDQGLAHQGPGGVFAMYLILTGVARFLVEFIRINPRSFFGLTNAQAASLVSLLAGALLLWRVKVSESLPGRREHP
jgi:phosphatidylglycerol---prolipoprotein diacylglyceryl transferase